MKKKKLDDFGQKIGGARKDLWKTRGLIVSDIKDMSETEKADFVRRDNIWPKEKFLSEDDNERFIHYWRDSIRLSVYQQPGCPNEDSKERYERYIRNVRFLKEKTENVDSVADISEFYDEMMGGIVVKHNYGRYYDMTTEYYGVVNGNKFMRYHNHLGELRKKMDQEGYGLTKDQFMKRRYPIVMYDPKTGSCETREVYNKFYLVLRTVSGSSYFDGDPCDLCTMKQDDFVLLDGKGTKVVTYGTEEHCKLARKDIIDEALMREKESEIQKKAEKQSKKKWILPQLSEMVRTGEDYRHNANVTGKMLMKTFGIRAGEFGNWENSNDRQTSLNMAYDAFKDIARILNIPETDVSLPGLSLGSLAIAFGARGRKKACAHYEPSREVINLTKMKGAGALGHEYGHAVDDFMAKSYGIMNGLATEHLSELKKKKNYPKTLFDLVDTMIYSKEQGKRYTKYYEDSRAYDCAYSKSGNGYWSSKCELFARAFACYLLDKGNEKGIRDDYLSGLAEAYRTKTLTAYPIGEERKAINKAFDDLFAELKSLGLLHDFDWEADKRAKEEKEKIRKEGEKNTIAYTFFTEDDTGQLFFA